MVWSAGAAVGVGGAGVAPGGVVGEGGVGGAGGVGVAGDCMVDGSGRVPSPPLAGAWWFVGSPAVVALVSSGGRGCWWRR